MGKSSVFSLDAYEKKANELYGHYDIRVDADTIVRLNNPLRVKDEKRARLFEIVEDLKFDGDKATAEDVARMTPLMLEIIQLVGDENVDKLLDRMEDDLAIIMPIFQDYFAAVGLGEASSSES